MLDDFVNQPGERWHMPGHKGQEPLHGDFLDWRHDVTEIGPMDQSPNPVELSERLMAETYGAERTWYSVQGATLPVMAAILAANPPGSTLWVDRTAHRSVVGALIIGGYRVRWLYPEFLRAGLMLPLTEFPEDFGDGAGLVLTRPTYDGLAAPITAVIERAHAAGLTVVIDEAHGSHWRGLGYPPSALGMGADLVAHGVHKSQASLTQTGLLHLQGERVSRTEIDRWWRLLGTSSPSYLLLASLDRLQWERHQPDDPARWHSFRDQVLLLWHTMEERGIPILQTWARDQGFDVDPARLTILGPGRTLKAILKNFGEVEKVTAGSATLFLAPDQPLSRVLEGLAAWRGDSTYRDPARIAYPMLPTALPVRDTWGKAARRVRLVDAQGGVVTEALTPYPPGIPVAVPGEVLTQEMIEWLLWWQNTALGPIQGLTQEEGGPWVWILA